MPALVTALGRVPRINRDDLPTSFCRFVGKDVEELTPPDIRDGAGQVGLDHVGNLQIFVGNYVVFIDQPPGGFVVKVQPLTADFLMGFGDQLHGLFAPVAALFAA